MIIYLPGTGIIFLKVEFLSGMAGMHAFILPPGLLRELYLLCPRSRSACLDHNTGLNSEPFSVTAGETGISFFPAVVGRVPGIYPVCLPRSVRTKRRSGA